MENRDIRFGDIIISILSNSDNLTVSELLIPAGAVASPHHHPHEEVNYILSGVLDFMCDGKTTTLKAGEYFRIPPNTQHNITNSGNSDGKVISVWTPSREDLIAKLKQS